MGIAMEMLLTGDYVTSEDAERWGLVNRIDHTTSSQTALRAGRADRRQRADLRPADEGDRGQGPRAAALAGAPP